MNVYLYVGMKGWCSVEGGKKGGEAKIENGLSIGRCDVYYAGLLP